MTKIAILGSHPATKRQAPFDDPSWKIWACSPHNFEHGLLPRVDEWFEVHVPAFCPQTRKRPYLDYVRELSEKIPVWMRDRSEHPNALEYPEEAIKANFGEFWCKINLTSSIAYIAAKAIASQPDAIGFWGIMQQSNEEYAYQRPGIQNIIDKAHERGIAVYVPDISALFKPPENIW